jgi:hypothetical protein
MPSSGNPQTADVGGGRLGASDGLVDRGTAAVDVDDSAPGAASLTVVAVGDDDVDAVPPSSSAHAAAPAANSTASMSVRTRMGRFCSVPSMSRDAAWWLHKRLLI